MRRFTLLLAGLALLAGVAAGVSGGGTQAEARWVITDLGTLGGERSEAVAINERGQIIGSVDKGEDKDGHSITRAFLWEKGTMRDLGTLPGMESSQAVAINERGQIVGTSWNFPLGSNEHAFLWQRGKMIDLGALGRGWTSDAVAISDVGQAIGTSTSAKVSYDNRAFLWQRGKMIDLGTLAGQQETWPADINEHGQVVGTSGGFPFLWENGRMRELRTAGKRKLGSARAINNRGQIAGSAVWENGRVRDLGVGGKGEGGYAWAISERGQIIGPIYTVYKNGSVRKTHGFVWTRGKVTELPRAPTAINDRGQVVGEDLGLHMDNGAAPPARAFLWQKGTLVYLTTLGGREAAATDINNRGQIVGQSDTRQKDDYGAIWHGVLWTLKP